MASSTQDEEALHCKEEDALGEEPELIDLNIEAKHEDDDKILSHSGLSLSNSQVRKKFQQLLEESGENERRFSVYGPDGKVHEIWLGKEKSSFGLTIGWWRFVVEYWLKEWCNFVTVWMFRHRDTQRICLAIDVTTFAFRKQVSKRISEAAFEDSD
ncbi:hypothetical protein F2Q68_00024094 [Brassica cretica]|uniref:TF-B3 domain-containing protein n=1 Tax=Brassica cretica TaxID=69181 RepID=A0A8S9IGC3_BRACR|nr:hypothetical protein F2Q68_00024094 [Brassica cretica]